MKKMFKCIKCNKEFKYESDYNRHKNRKNPCNIIKQDLSCNLCNIKFNCNAEKLRHEKTNKHINNYNKCNIQNNVNGDNIQQIINLTLNVNSFKNTDTSLIRQSLINNIGECMYLETINKDYLSNLDKVKILFNSVIEILEKLHFNLDIEENHNLKILLMFPSIKKKLNEYLILEINPDTKEIVWNSVEYNELMKQIFRHLYNLNNKIQNDNYDKFILFLERYIVKDEDTKIELKECIENKLSEMYINFNVNQKKSKREIKENLHEKISEYKNYRTKECKLNNGYDPEIINSKV